MVQIKQIDTNLKVNNSPKFVDFVQIYFNIQFFVISVQSSWIEFLILIINITHIWWLLYDLFHLT